MSNETLVKVQIFELDLELDLNDPMDETLKGMIDVFKARSKHLSDTLKNELAMMDWIVKDYAEGRINQAAKMSARHVAHLESVRAELQDLQEDILTMAVESVRRKA